MYLRTVGACLRWVRCFWFSSFCYFLHQLQQPSVSSLLTSDRRWLLQVSTETVALVLCFDNSNNNNNNSNFSNNCNNNSNFSNNCYNNNNNNRNFSSKWNINNNKLSKNYDSKKSEILANKINITWGEPYVLTALNFCLFNECSQRQLDVNIYISFLAATWTSRFTLLELSRDRELDIHYCLPLTST